MIIVVDIPRLVSSFTFWYIIATGTIRREQSPAGGTLTFIASICILTVVATITIVLITFINIWKEDRSMLTGFLHLSDMLSHSLTLYNMLFVVCYFFQNQHFLKIISGTSSECQTDWIGIMLNISSCLILGPNCEYSITGNIPTPWLRIESKSYPYNSTRSGLFPTILGKGPWPKLGKNERLNIKIGRN